MKNLDIINIEGIINELDKLDDETFNPWTQPSQIALLTNDDSLSSGTQSLSSITSSLQSSISFNLFDNEISQNLSQIDCLLQIIRNYVYKSTKFQIQIENDKLNQLEQINKRYTNLKDLFDEYKRIVNRTTKTNNINDLRYLQYLILRRLNNLCDFFGLNKTYNISILQHQTNFDQVRLSNSNSLISILNETDKYESLCETQIQSLTKLRITTIRLDDESSDEFICFIYLFDNSKCIADLRQSTIDAKLNKASKRSSSADHSTSTLKRRFRLKEDNKQNKYNESLNLETPNIVDYEPGIQLSEKCIFSYSFKFKSSASLNEIIDVHSSCTHVTFIIYKTTSFVDGYKFRYPIKYMTLTLNENKNSLNVPFDLVIKPTQGLTNSFLFSEQYLSETHKIALTSIEALLIAPVTQTIESSSSSSNVFKRMFKKSKSQSRTTSTNGLRIRENSTSKKFKTLAEVKNENSSYICIDVSTNLSEELTHRYKILNLDKFDAWRELWRPSLDTLLNLNFESLLNSSPKINIELLNIYFQSITYFSPLQHRSKLAQHQLNKSSPKQKSGDKNDLINCLFFIQVTLESLKNEALDTKNYQFRTSLFKLNEKINELCQIPLEIDSEFNNEKRIKLELFKIELGKVVFLTASSVSLSRRQLSNINDLDFSQDSSSSLNLKLKFAFVSEFYPTKRTSSDLYEFAIENGFTIEKEKDFLIVIESYLNACIFNEPILIHKFIEIFYFLNIPTDELLIGSPVLSPLSRKNENNNRKLIRRVIHSKSYEAFVRILDECYSNISNNFSYTNLLKNIKGSSFRPAAQFLMNFIKNLPESDVNLFNLTIKAFPAIIDLLLKLSANSKSRYELKYEINDLILKLFTGKHIDNKRRATICTNLNLKFLNHLTDLFTPFELSNLISSKFLHESSDPEIHSLIFKTINKNLFKIDLFDSNYQFRENLVNFIVKTYLNINKLKNLDIIDILDLVKKILGYKSKLSRNNLDSLINSSLRYMIDTATLIINNDPSISSVKFFDIFICLIELIDLTMLNKSSLEILTSEHLSNLFQSFKFYFESDTLNSKPDAHKLYLWINLLVLKFSKYVQKILNRYLIMKCDDEEMLVMLIRDYFEFLFSCINRPTSSYSQTMNLKLQVIQTISIFWRSLNFKLKRSVFLTELVISRLSQCLISNFYFKLIQIEPLDLFLNPFANLNNSKSNLVFLFYENCLKLIADIQTLNQFDNEQIKDITLLNLMSFVVKNDKLRQKGNRKSNDSEILIELKIKNFSNEIIKLLSELIQNNSIIDQLKSIAEYNLIREEDMYESTFKISIIEKFVLIHDLYKQIDRLELNNRLILNPSLIIEAKRKIQMNLLDDLYFLHKQEKNCLQMSFVRKEQADLLEWNLSKKTESDLKDILYLKSLKKFAINSLQEKINDSSVYVSNLSTSESNISSSTSTFSSTTSITAPSTSSPSIPSTPSSQSQCSNNPKDLININSPTPPVVSTNQSTDQNFFTSIQFEICKQLCAYYEKLDENYSKFTRVLGAEAKLINLTTNTTSKSTKGNEIVKNNQHGHLYFRVGFFGSCLQPASIRNKYFLYKHHSYDMVSNVQSLIVNRLMYNCGDEDHVINDTVLLHHNQEPDISLKKNNLKCYLQVCAVNRLEKSKLIELIDEMNDDKETLDIKDYVNKYDDLAYFYYFDRPFYSRKINDGECDELSEGVENLWLERTILITDEYGTKYENLTQFEYIKEIYKILLNPIRNAINDINEKTKEMKNFVIQFTASNSNLNIGYTTNLNVIHNLQPLTMRLLGCLDARVNGGLIKYVRELLVENLSESKSNKKRAILLYQLYISIKEQLKVLESGLNIHDRILKEIEVKYKDLKLEENELDSKQQKNYEHIKHMVQLNIHLIECFKMIENELNEKWAKFSADTVLQ